MTDKNDSAWRSIFESNKNLDLELDRFGLVSISADEIRRFREPRLMTKHDSIDGVPASLKTRGINVLSVSRSKYLLGRFDVFESFPNTEGLKPVFCEFPPFETLDTTKISSEANAINALVVSGLLNDFLDDDLVETFNGRMGSGLFDFLINDKSSCYPFHISVSNAQIEIDGGFESDKAVVILEAKNVLHSDFNVRQLYYPFRKYYSFVTKPIRLVFSQYTNLTYHLFEYTFEDPSDYNSISLVNTASYTFEDTRITLDELQELCSHTQVIFDDVPSNSCKNIPFPQADKIDRIFSLLEFLLSKMDYSAQTSEIAEYMGVVERQASYYPSAAEYLGFVKREPNITRLSSNGKLLLGKKRRERLLGFAEAIFKHKIFNELFIETIKCGCFPDKNQIIAKMEKLKVLGDNPSSQTLFRRSSTVAAWLRWVFELAEDSDY